MATLFHLTFKLLPSHRKCKQIDCGFSASENEKSVVLYAFIEDKFDISQFDEWKESG